MQKLLFSSLCCAVGCRRVTQGYAREKRHRGGSWSLLLMMLQRSGDTGSLSMLSAETCQLLKSASSWPRGLFSVHKKFHAIRYCCPKPHGFIYVLQGYIVRFSLFRGINWCTESSRITCFNVPSSTCAWGKLLFWLSMCFRSRSFSHGQASPRPAVVGTKPSTLLVDEMAQICTILCFDYGLCVTKNHVLEPAMKTAERKNAAGAYEISPPCNKCYS